MNAKPATARRGQTLRRASMLDVRRGVPPLHGAGLHWITARSLTTEQLQLTALDLTTWHPVDHVTASWPS